MPTSAREAVTNSPKIFVKTVRSAGPMWASAPTNVLGRAYGFALGFRKKHCFQRADRVVGSYALRQSQNASFACVLERKKEADRISSLALQGCVPKGFLLT